MQGKNELSSVFGIHAVEELLKKHPQNIDKIYFTEKEKRGTLFEMMKQCKKRKISYANIPESKLDKMAGGGNHQGVVAFKTVRAYNDESDLWELLEVHENPLLLIPSSLEDPGNLGAIIRSACAFGVDAILLERKGTVPLNGTVAKTSAGMIEQMMLVKPVRLEAMIEQLKMSGFTVIGIDGYGDGEVADLNFTGPTILITGGEHKGIPPYLRRLCDGRAKIPMAEGVESLNVSVAAGITLYEAMKQRRFSM